MLDKLGRAASGLINLLLPHRCLLCNEIIAEIGFCDGCHNKMHFIAPPYCECCGFPLFVDNAGSEHFCATCLQRRYKRYQFSKMRSVFVWDEDSKELMYDLKYRDRTHTAKFLGACMAYVGRELMSGVDIVVPVPLHRRRLLKRKYNQAVLLAKTIAKIYRIPLRPRALIREKNTEYQRKLMTNAQRVENVRGAFKARDKEVLTNKTVLLVDDLFTTGATVDECSKELIKAGAKEIRALTLARRVF